MGRLGAVLGASWAVLERFWGPLGRSWSVRSPKRRESKKPSKTIEKTMNFASWGPLGTPLGGLLARFGGHLSCLGTIVGVLERSLGVSGPSWTILGASWARLEAVLVRFAAVWEPLETLPREGTGHVQGGSLPGARGPGSPIYVYVCTYTFVLCQMAYTSTVQ